MKKIKYAIITIFTLLIVFATCVSASSNTRVIDDAGILTTDEKETLETTISEIKNNYNFDVVILTKKNLEGKTPKDYADNYYDKGGYGLGSERDGMLLLLSTESRDYYISTKGYGRKAFTEYGVEYISNDLVEYLKDNNYYDAFEGFLSNADIFLKQTHNDAPFDADNPVVIGTPVERALGVLIIITPVSILIAFIIVMVKRGKHKTAVPENFANNYVRKDSFNLIKETDTFLYTDTTKTKIEKESSSDNNSSYTSGSDDNHGGGGGKY